MLFFSLGPALATHGRWLYPAFVVGVATLLGQIFGLGLALLVFAGGVLGGAIWLIWSSLQGLSGDLPITLDEALSLGAPSAEEEQKRAVLRALKDLEYERAVGKINDEDYGVLAQHYRNEAKRLLRVVDRDLSPEREKAERILAERLGRASGTRPEKVEEEAEAASGGASERSAVATVGDEDDESSPPAPAKTPSSDPAE